MSGINPEGFENLRGLSAQKVLQMDDLNNSYYEANIVWYYFDFNYN